MKLRLIAPIAAVLLTGSAALAEGTVSLDSCRNMALRTSKALLAADEAVRGAGYARKAAASKYLPAIDASATYIYHQHKTSLLKEDAKVPTMYFNPLTQKYEYDFVVGPDGLPVTDPASGLPVPALIATIPKEALTFDTRSIFAGAVTLTQPIYMGGEIKALNDIAKYSEQALEAGRESASQDVVFEVDQNYWLVVSLVAKQKLAQSFVNLIDTLHYNVNAMLEEGVATRADLLTIDVQRNEARIMLNKVENGLSLSRMALAQACGLPVDTQLRLEDEQDTLMPAVPAGYDSDDMSEVYGRRKDLEVVRKGINMLEGQEKLALGTMLPKIALVGAYNFSTPNVIDGFSRHLKGGFSIGAGITIPIWHWGGDYNTYKAAKSATNAQRILLQDLEDKVTLQVRQARFKYAEAFRTYNMARENMRSAEENLRCAREGFKEGVLTANDVVLAQTGWLQAHSEKIDAEIGVRLCDVYLSKVLGNLSTSR
ncbi:MAG: TolC family protein [Muribaculaceae bacterium]|nr:TolC family protein [Muribaculaceae bacterium]